MRYVGIVEGGNFQHMCALEEVRTAEPPIRLEATFFEPGSVEEVVADLRAGNDAVVAVASPMTGPRDGRDARVADVELRHRGVFPLPPTQAGAELYRALMGWGLYTPASEEGEGEVEEGAFRQMPVFETNPDGVFCALQGQRLPAKRHPLGIQRRIEELIDDQIEDPGEDLWLRRIEEIEAAAAALTAHRFAVGHACWVGDPAEGVIVLPGSHLPESFSGEGVIPPVPRASLRSG